MRPIKFRAWDKEKKFMYYSNTNQTVWVGGACASINGEKGQITTMEYDDIMQFTGFRDKNCKEIYEGDILGVYLNCKNLFLRTVKWNDELAKFQALFSDGSGLQLFTRRQCLEYEVIGNIHENPELLEQK